MRWKAGSLPPALRIGRAVRNAPSQRPEAAECRRKAAVRFAYLNCVCELAHGDTGDTLTRHPIGNSETTLVPARTHREHFHCSDDEAE